MSTRLKTTEYTTRIETSILQIVGAAVVGEVKNQVRGQDLVEAFDDQLNIFTTAEFGLVHVAGERWNGEPTPPSGWEDMAEATIEVEPDETLWIGGFEDDYPEEPFYTDAGTSRNHLRVYAWGRGEPWVDNVVERYLVQVWPTEQE